MKEKGHPRSAAMLAVKKSGTKLESSFRDILLRIGIVDFDLQAEGLPGTPDFLFRARAIALFVDSCFWHGCPEHVRMPASNQAYWTAKIARNRSRDTRQTKELIELGWRVVRVWEHELKQPHALEERLLTEFREFSSCSISANPTPGTVLMPPP